MSSTTKIPLWIKSEIFKGILSAKFTNFKEILDMQVEPALSGGENYVSTVLRVTTKIEKNDASLENFAFILKIPLCAAENNNTSTTNEYHDLFVSETTMYNDVIPNLVQIFEMYGCTSVQFTPQHYVLPQTLDCDYILMEDLKQKGFLTGQRLVGLGEIHTKYALAKLAQFHAATVKHVEVHGAFAATFRESYFNADNREMIKSMNAAFEKPFLECMQSYNMTKEAKLIIQNYMQQLNELYQQFGEIDDNALNVLNHGDFWLNNFMFQYNASGTEITEMLMIDFQLPKYGTPAQDLFCFLMTTPAWDLKLSKFDAFVAYYHERLYENLLLLKCQQNSYTLTELHASLQRNSLWGFVCAQRMLAVALLDPYENSNIETFLSDNMAGVAFKKRMFYNPRYVQQIEKILPWLIARKYLKNI